MKSNMHIPFRHKRILRAVPNLPALCCLCCNPFGASSKVSSPEDDRIYPRGSHSRLTQVYKSYLYKVGVHTCISVLYYLIIQRKRNYQLHVITRLDSTVIYVLCMLYSYFNVYIKTRSCVLAWQNDLLHWFIMIKYPRHCSNYV